MAARPDSIGATAESRPVAVKTENAWKRKGLSVIDQQDTL